MGLSRPGRRLVLVLFILGVFLALAWLALGMTPKPLLVNQANSGYAVADRDGRLLRLMLSSDEKYRVWTPLRELPPSLQEATIRYEDRWFHWHPGVNPAALARGFWSSFVSRGRWMGGPTLSMQLARQRWRLKTNNLSGKFQQIGYALWLERHFTKSELLEAYLNLVPYGANIEGAGAAAWAYFHKPATRLSPEEAQALALIPQNPSRRSPLTEMGKQALREAWPRAIGTAPAIDRLWFRSLKELPLRAPHFSERVHELYPDQSSPVTSLDPRIQGLTEAVLTGFLRQQRTKGITNAMAMVVHAPTLEVLGYVGSADYLDRRIQGYVNGLKALRSPGSTLKPFIYGLALGQGLITPDTLLKDVPLRMAEYQPENFERNFYGPLSATDALVRSRNIPAVVLMAQLQRPTLYEFLERAGGHLPRSAAYYGMTLAMGGAEVSMEQLLGLFAVLANGGDYRPLRWLRGGEAGRAIRLLSPEAAFLVREMLEANPPPERSHGLRRFGSRPPVAWKTGTSSGLKDAWAVGIAGELLVGVWAGNFDGTPNERLIGRDLVGPPLFAILEAIALEYPGYNARPQAPPGLKKVEICPLTGAPRSPWCPHAKQGWVIPGVSPLGVCKVHRRIHLHPASGLRLCRGDEARGRETVAEFWDSEMLEMFHQAGLRRELPPPFERPCDDLGGGDSGGQAPRILSPQPGLTYPIRGDGQSNVEFSAVGASRRLYWFVDDAYVGQGETLIWPGKPGSFLVRVVDDQGRSASTRFNAVPAE